ncbi:MAG TPA: methylated-DNA--[protein]-cysteine S-methyltransferase [Thermoflexia bacterium]|jgi:methylated-DNA-[protein]-cysteine S-methyltransferase|nr:methylated-DNA--[protein]-cysteine S-methyltransferase [Thermoflexia bacterium]
MIFYTTMDSPVGRLYLAGTERGVCRIAFEEEPLKVWLARHLGVEPEDEPGPLTEVVVQLREYFSRLRRRFDVPMDLRGTPFQRAVWREVASIPYGTTATYGEIARRLGKEGRAARAVGAAVGANPLPILIPCHRVIGADGLLVGYGGGLSRKVQLLRLEGVRV